ncbi:MAG: FIST C-terminal domain-containing protein [Polyangiaceae bacterium]|nr:FIST C-terminal domain-containing protein [Polyangiaceae bacterium]
MSIRAAVAFSEDIDDPHRAGLDIAEQILTQLKLGPRSVGILFASIDFHAESLLGGIRERLPIPIVGCTTASEANSAGYFEESASLIVITGEDLAVGIGLGDDLTKDPASAVRSACDAATAMLGRAEPKLAITFPDCAFTTSGDHVLRLLTEKLGASIPIVGGVPGDGLRFKGALQFWGDRVTTDSIPLVLLGGAMTAVVVTRSGWIPMGRRARATRVSGNVLYEIDNRPALEYFTRYIATPGDPSIMGSLPVALIDRSLDDDEGRHFILRAPLVHDKDTGAVTYNGDIPLNAQIQLARGTQEDILEGVRDATRTLRRRAGDLPIDALLCFSCVGRRLLLGLETKREIELILHELARDGLPAEGSPRVTPIPGIRGGSLKIPVNGFYTYGEIGPIDSSRRHLAASKFHNTTLVLCAISGLSPPSTSDELERTPAMPAAVDLEVENQRLKRENLRLSRNVRKLEERIETIDKMARANEQVSLSLYSEIERVRRELEDEKRKVDSLLLNILPAPIAERLKTRTGTIAEAFPAATVLFSDIVGFTALSEQIPPDRVVSLLSDLFSAFDDLVERYQLEKIKTIGDAYMVAGGIPHTRADHAVAVAALALDMQGVVADFARRLSQPMSIRIGIHSGPVVAGVIGKKKFIYDLWGDTVNTAARMESHGIPGQIQVSERSYGLLRDDFELEERGPIQVKDKGVMRTWLLLGRKPTMSVRGIPYFF